MIIAELHNSKISELSSSDQVHDWSSDGKSYNQQEISEMPKWIENEKNAQLDIDYCPVDTACFSEEQSLAYNILNHASQKLFEPLLLIVTGGARTGKSYLINAVRNYFRKRCVVTATT